MKVFYAIRGFMYYGDQRKKTNRGKRDQPTKAERRNTSL